MTKVQTTMRTAYLAGPMRGYEEFNFPAFRKAAKWLRKDGWTIESPHERDEAEGFDPVNDEAHSLDYYMQFDLAMVSRTDAVICLPGWEGSQGARLETMVATELGHPVFEITFERGLEMNPGQITKTKEKEWQLTSVAPEYVIATFADKSMRIFEGDTVSEAVLAAGEANLAADGIKVEVVEDESQFMKILEQLPSYPPQAFEYPPGDWPFPPTADMIRERIVEPVDIFEAGRKAIPLASGVLDYFPAALVEVSKVSVAGNEKHNPGQPLHHARGKSSDHADALLRHLVDRGKIDTETGMRHSAEVAWRGLALLQQELEDEGLAPLPRGARLAD